MKFAPCCVIPSRNHYLALPTIVRAVCQAGLPIFLIDDASDEPARSAIAVLSAPTDGVSVERLTERRGKGGAVMAGMRMAAAAGFTHVVQIDADGQHVLDPLMEFVAFARERPDAFVCGAAQYDHSVPVGRRLGRYLTHAWVWIETLSLEITDAMCGFRVYPLDAVIPLISSERLGRFMEFDIEIAVRLSWQGVPILSVPVDVIYPAVNTSNFELLRDNVRITLMHTRLFGSMLRRLPKLLRERRRARTHHWSSLSERGIACGLRFLASVYLTCGRTVARIVLLPIVTYFYATDPIRRRASREFLERAYATSGIPSRTGLRAGILHYLDFGEKALETLAAWVGCLSPDRIRTTDAAVIDRARSSSDGAVLIVSHLGNADLSRALLAGDLQKRLTVLVHTRLAERYNSLLWRFQPQSAVNLLQVTEVGPETAVLLQERIARGEWIAIAGDRTPVGGDGRVSLAPFLGRPAPFPQGPYILAHLLRCPVYILFCLREMEGHRLYFEKFADRINLPRDGRDGALNRYVARYAERLEFFAKRAPLQWYNFFDFWEKSRPEGTIGR